jgi:hypothetical protein
MVKWFFIQAGHSTWTCYSHGRNPHYWIKDNKNLEIANQEKDVSRNGITPRPPPHPSRQKRSPQEKKKKNTFRGIEMLKFTQKTLETKSCLLPK